MQISAEIRWFWQEENELLTKASETWFDRTGIEAGGGGLRKDVYARDSGVELGIKLRGGKSVRAEGSAPRLGPGLELKGLISYLTPIALAPLQGSTELWGKWSTALLEPPKHCVGVSKQRWLRKFDFDSAHIVEVPLDGNEKPVDPAARLPTLGCHVERTRVEIDGRAGAWWTVGFEAFGPVDSVERVLHRTVDRLHAGAPDFASAIQMSYPRWLACAEVNVKK